MSKIKTATHVFFYEGYWFQSRERYARYIAEGRQFPYNFM